jgi:transmembrane sensor
MSNATRLSSDRLNKEEAGQWIARIDRGLSREEHEALIDWLCDPQRRKILFRLAGDWDRIAVVAELAELFPLLEAESFRWRFVGRAAAVLLLAGALAAVASYMYPRFVPMQSAQTPVQPAPRNSIPEAGFHEVYSTAIGELRTVELPDHSHLRLNTNTELQVEFSDSARLLTMSRGEAMFEVAKDPSRVFTVRIAGYEFKAVGTAFNIRADSPSGLQLTVTEGRVRVHHSLSADRQTGEAHGIASSVFEDANDTVVEANKSVSIAEHSERIDTLTPDQVAAATAWQHGAIVFKSTPLAQVINELARYSTERFVIAEPELANIPVSGYFEVGDIDTLAAALQQNVHITVTRHDDYLLLSGAQENQ